MIQEIQAAKKSLPCLWSLSCFVFDFFAMLKSSKSYHSVSYQSSLTISIHFRSLRQRLSETWPRDISLRYTCSFMKSLVASAKVRFRRKSAELLMVYLEVHIKRLSSDVTISLRSKTFLWLWPCSAEFSLNQEVHKLWLSIKTTSFHRCKLIALDGHLRLLSFLLKFFRRLWWDDCTHLDSNWQTLSRKEGRISLHFSCRVTWASTNAGSVVG